MAGDKERMRLRALLAKALDNGSTDAERETAMTMAARLMDKYGLTEADVVFGGAPDSHGVGDYHHPFMQNAKGVQYLHPVWRMCGVTVSKFCGINCYLDDRKNALRMLGAPADMELAVWLLGHLQEQCEAAWAAYKAGRQSRNLVALRDARINFLRAFCQVINERLRDWLFRVVPKEYRDGLNNKVALANGRMIREGIVTAPGRQDRAHVREMAGAAGAGVVAGQSASLGRGVGATAGLYLPK